MDWGWVQLKITIIFRGKQSVDPAGNGYRDIYIYYAKFYGGGKYKDENLRTNGKG